MSTELRPAPSNITAGQYRLFRRLARVVTAVAGSRRKAALEALLRWRFGDLVEARGHLLSIDPRDRAVGARLRRRGIWSEAETALCTREVQAGMTVLDIGANIGYFTLLFARLVGSEGQVFAIEPDPYNLQLLRENVVRNGYRNVTVLPTAVSRQEGVARLFKNPDNFGDHRLGHGGDGRESVEVPVTTLDALAPLLGKRIDFIKMDIQGSEGSVLAGGREVFGSAAPMKMVSEFWPEGMRANGDDPMAYLHTLHEYGFRLSYIAPGKRLVLTPLPEPKAFDALCARGGEVNLFATRS